MKRWRGLLVVAGLAALGSSVVLLLVVWKTEGLDTAADVGQVVGVVLALPALVVGLTMWWSHSRRPSATAPDQVMSAAGVLARLVAAQWREEAARRSLDDPDPIPVRWQLTALPVMDHAASVAVSGPVVWGGTADRIGELAVQFRGLRRRRLVILGGPGMGKTTLAVQLVRELLATRADGEPVPVLVSAASWDDKVPDVWGWLARRLKVGYPALSAAEFGGQGATYLATDRMVLPVIDGLDEVPARTRAKILACLNRTLGDVGQLIITCRTDEYRQAIQDAADVLTGAAVTEPAPLTPETAADYLALSLPPAPPPAWQHLLDRLRSDGSPALTELCSTPLGLWLLRTTYIRPGVDPTPLTDPLSHPTPADLRAHMFDQLAAALVTTRPPTDNPQDLFRPLHAYEPNDVQRWLGFLAGYLGSSRDLSWWLLTRAAFNPPITRALAALPSGVDPSSMPMSYWASATRGWADANLAAANLRLTGRVASLCRWLAFGLIGGLALGLAVASLFLLVEDGDGITFGLAFGPALGLTSGVSWALTMWAEVPVSTDDASTPMNTWRAERTLNLFRIRTAMLAGALSGTLTFWLAYGPTIGLIFGLPGGLLYGLVVAYSGEDSAWGGYVAVARRLARLGLCPRDLMGFLDDAHRLGLLRIIGPVYQFRHAEYQDHLAARYKRP
ncbi:NACHT domain-containing protein [Nonomuraea jiangxiensis]|uniref:NACHT domain-containing protein n=1 Tax=Nonomuraea jiangxiensis TaxID=633440 RepID=A0A1G9LIY1_9ACTN|nr:NACHT domain-containing protein [Nonomuraea jiangxiensis]SDL61876.1 NACHT domain-containing protein [Nonomuraea jiangxiensis]